MCFIGTVPVLRKHPRSETAAWREPTPAEVTHVRLGEPIDFEILRPYLFNSCESAYESKTFELRRTEPMPLSIHWGIVGSFTSVEYFPDGRIELWGASDEDWSRVVDHVVHVLSDSGCLR